MNNTDIIYLVLFFVCLLFSAFFSSSEVAFISLQRMRLRHLATTEGSEGATAKQVATMTEKPERLLTTVLLGNNLVNTAAAALATIVVASFLTKGQAVLVSTVGVTIVLLIFGEVFPKVTATRYGERLAFLYATPMRALIWILAPIASIFVWIADKLARLIGAHPSSRKLTSEEEIRTALTVGVEEGTLMEAEAEMLERVFRFGDRQAAELMTPRPDITWVERGTTFADFLAIYAETPHSRFPVYQDTIDNVVGVLWIKDVLMAQAKGQLKEDKPVDEMVRPGYFVPESKPVAELLSELQKSGSHIAVVVDEFGGTAGLVTMELLLEEIVGELGDELAKRHKSYEPMGENSFQIDGNMRIEEANEQLTLGLPEGDYETVAEMKGVKIEKILVTREL
jgi:putative hemolysin